jgi:hypothetical protein
VSYPKWLYHPTKEALIVPDEAAHKALGPGWYESPADFPPAPAQDHEPNRKSAPLVEPKPKKVK